MDNKYLPYNIKLTKLAKTFRKNLTPAERRLWYDHLRDHKYKFIRQKPIGDFIVDFYCSKLKLVIEVDGETHIDEKDKLYDRERTKVLNKLGLKILRFWNYDILEGFDTVAEIIESEIKKMGRDNL